MSDQNKALMEMNTDDFNTMRTMLSEIEMKLLQIPPLKQKAFYAAIQAMIFEAWQDACNYSDDFLHNTFDNEGAASCRMLMNAQVMLNALREAEAGLQAAGADILTPPSGFIPSPTLALREVRKAIHEATKPWNA